MKEGRVVHAIVDIKRSMMSISCDLDVVFIVPGASTYHASEQATTGSNAVSAGMFDWFKLSSHDSRECWNVVLLHFTLFVLPLL